MPFLASGTFRLRVFIGDVSRWIGGDNYDAATLFVLEPGQDMTGISHVESGLECVFDPAGPLPDTQYDVILRTATSVFYNNSCEGTVLRFANLVPGDIYLKIDGWGMRDVWLSQHWDRRASPEEADPITIPPGGGVANVTVTLVQGARVFGRLLDVQGRPLSPGEMFLMVYATDDSVDVVNLYTDWDFSVALYNVGNGDYVLTQLRDGQYKMRAHVGDNPWIWWPGRAAWDSAGVFTIENATDLSGIDWRLPY